MLHSTINQIAGSAEHSPPHQLKASDGEFLHFKEKTLQLCQYLHQQQSCVMPLFNMMTSNNLKMDWYNTLYLNYGHNVTFNFNYVLTGLMTILAYIYNCKMGFVSNCLKAFRLQIMVQAPMSATTFSNCYLGPLDQRPSIWRWGEYVPQQLTDDTPQQQEVVMQLKWCPFPLATYSKREKEGNESIPT